MDDAQMGIKTNKRPAHRGENSRDSGERRLHQRIVGNICNAFCIWDLPNHSRDQFPFAVRGTSTLPQRALSCQIMRKAVPDAVISATGQRERRHNTASPHVARVQRTQTVVTAKCDPGHSIHIEHMRIFACMKQPLISSNGKVLQAVARRFKVLGEPQRLRILQVLETGPKTVGELVAALGANQPNVSRHLQALFDAGLVERRRNGNSVTCSVSDPMVFRMCKLVCANVVERARTDMAEIMKAGG